MSIAQPRRRRFVLLSLLLAALGCGAWALLPSTAQAFAPYKLGPPAAPRSAHQRMLLRGSSLVVRNGWMVVRLHGGPFRVGFQNGYLSGQSAHYYVLVDLGAPGSAYRRQSETIAREFVWPLIPTQYRKELRGIAAGMHAAGYRRDSLWDVVAANDWADQPCYATLLGRGSAPAVARAAAAATRARKGGCSAFIATGAATADGRPVMGHNTWSAYDQNFMYNIMFYVYPSHGLDFSYQSAGGQIWSGQDWYENSAGLMLCETTLADTTYNPKGLPVFVRARLTAQYARTVGQAVRILRSRNNGAYSNEWLVGDASGTIASLQLGHHAYDLNITRNGFFGSSNYDWGPHTRAEEGAVADPPAPANDDYARRVRWGQLKKLHWGSIDLATGQAMEADTYDTFLGKICPDERTLCGEPENGSAGVPYSGDYDGGAYDAKVCTETMVRAGLQVMARWGHPDGDGFDAARFLAANPHWAADNGALAVFGLRTFSVQTPNPWALLRAS